MKQRLRTNSFVMEEVALSFMQQRDPFLNEDHFDASNFLIARKSSAVCALPHSAPTSLNTLREQVLPMAEITVSGRLKAFISATRTLT
jgi:hypothetical protein